MLNAQRLCTFCFLARSDWFDGGVEKPWRPAGQRQDHTIFHVDLFASDSRPLTLGFENRRVKEKG